jgi:hypothetical protein
MVPSVIAKEINAFASELFLPVPRAAIGQGGTWAGRLTTWQGGAIIDGNRLQAREWPRPQRVIWSFGTLRSLGAK